MVFLLAAAFFSNAIPPRGVVTLIRLDTPMVNITSSRSAESVGGGAGVGGAGVGAAGAGAHAVSNSAITRNASTSSLFIFFSSSGITSTDWNFLINLGCACIA